MHLQELQNCLQLKPSMLEGTIIFEIILFAIMYLVGKKTNWFGEIPETV
jgi:hypothetical protein